MNRRCLILLAGLLAGCARFEPQPLPPADTATRLEARRLDDDALKRFLHAHLGRDLESWPLPSWDLDMLTLAAFFFNPSLDVARAQLAVARAGEISAGGRPNPTLNLGPGYDASAGHGLSPWIPFVSVDLPVETAGKRRHRLAQAGHLSEAARLNLATAAWRVRSRVRAGLLDHDAAERREKLLEAQRVAQEQIVERLEQRLAAGAISQAELAPARIALNKTRLDLGDAEARRSQARARLAEAIGVGPEALASARLSFSWSAPGTDALTSALARRAALLGRSDVLGALADYAASQAALQLQVARQYPDVHLGPGYQFDQGDNKWTLGVSIELPVLNQNRGPIAEARARRDEAAARFVELQAKVLAEIDGAVAAHRAAQRQLATVDSLVADARQRQESVAAQVRAGAADPLDLLTAQFELDLAALAEVDGQTQLQQALGGLEDALQRPVASIAFVESTASLIHVTQDAPERSDRPAVQAPAGRARP